MTSRKLVIENTKAVLVITDEDGAYLTLNEEAEFDDPNVVGTDAVTQPITHDMAGWESFFEEYGEGQD